MSERNTEMRARHLEDQAWAALRQLAPEMRRIAASGPSGSEHDTLIVRRVMSCALGRLAMLAHDAEARGRDEDTKTTTRHNEFGVDLTGNADNVDRAVVALNLHSQAVEALRSLLRANAQLMPGIRHVACADYAVINEAPAMAAKVLARAESMG